jgi:hypothetical protein
MKRQLETPPENLDGFESWLLHRAQRPEEFSDAAECETAWHVLMEYRLCFSSLVDQGVA